MHTVKIIKDVEYSQRDGVSLGVDFYLPENAAGPVPVVLLLAGGGWRRADKSQGFSQFLPEAGIAMAIIYYTTSNVASAPAQIQDCKAAVRFFRSHAAEYGFDPDRIGVYGASAGGNLAALVGCASGVAEFEGEASSISSEVKAVCAVCGPMDLTRIGTPKYQENFRHLYDVTSQYLGGPVEERLELARLMSPITYVSSDVPPILLIHGDKDEAVPVEHSLIFHEALKKAGAPVTLLTLEGLGHDWLVEQTKDEVLAFFQKNL